MRAQEFIVEAFDQPYPLEWDDQFGPKEIHARAHDRQGQYIDINFVPVRDNVTDIEFSKMDSYDVTGGGDEIAVFSTVIAAIKRYLAGYQPKIIVFSGKGESRGGLYQRLVNRLAGQYGYKQFDTSKLSPEAGQQIGASGTNVFVLRKATQAMEEEVIDEMPLPTDWDASQFQNNTTSFRSRLAYALERAKKIGTGSSRIAMTIEYEGRPTVLKIAKNAKGLAQNSVEASILDDGYASQLSVLIPLIDYDTQNREPTWIHTELAQKASEKQLANMMGVDTLNDIVQLANSIGGKSRMLTYQGQIDYMRQRGKTEEQIDTATEYANALVDLNNSFDVELGDFVRKANWGLYQGKPVIIDVGFNSNVMNQYYK